MHRLDPKDCQFISLLIQKGVLEPMVGKVMPARVISVACPDGHQFMDLALSHVLLSMRDKGYEELLFHPLTDHGGASIMSPRSRIGLRSDADALVRKIGFAIQAKGAQHVALYAHSPCGAAAHYGVPLPTMLSDLVLAKQRVTEAYPALQSVACYFHVDRSGESGRLSAWKAFRRHPARVILKVLGIATHSSWIAFVGDHNKRTYHLDSDRLREWQSTKESREYLRATWGIS